MPFNAKMASLIVLEEQVASIVENIIDDVGVDQLGLKLNLRFTSDCDSMTRRHLLLKTVLLEVLKYENVDNRDRYEHLLALTLQNLHARHEGYHCTVVGCRYVAALHRNYMNHLKTSHLEMSRYVCKYKHICQRTFPTAASLVNHVEKDHVEHAKTTSTAIDYALENCKCTLISCGFKKFSNVKDLVHHMNVAHETESRMCIFDGCISKFKPSQLSRWHYSRKHKSMDHALKADFKVATVSSIESTSREGSSLATDEIDNFPPQDEQDFREADEVSGGHEDDPDEGQEEVEDPEENKHYFMMSFADFLNRMSSCWFHPMNHVKEVASKYLMISKESSRVKLVTLKKTLDECESLSESDKQKILNNTRENDPFLQAQEDLISEHKRTKFLEENFKLVKPVEIVLNPEEVKRGSKKESYQYIPIKATLMNVLEDETYIEAMNSVSNTSVDDEIKEIADGNALKSNKFFLDNPTARPLLIYSDAVELANPLGKLTKMINKPCFASDKHHIIFRI